MAHGQWSVEPGAYEFRTRPSSADLRRTARVELAGTAPGPRPVLATGLGAADHGGKTGTVITDLSRFPATR